MKDNNVELIAKLEQAKAGSRELDVAIWHLVETKFQRSDNKGWSIVPRGDRTVKDDVFAPSYTTSLDAGRGLLIPGAWWRISDDGTAEVGHREFDTSFVKVRAATPELAFCSAAMRLRELVASLKARA